MYLRPNFAVIANSMKLTTYWTPISTSLLIQAPVSLIAREGNGLECMVEQKVPTHLLWHLNDSAQQEGQSVSRRPCIVSPC